MKKITLLPLLAVLTLILSACGAARPSTTASASGGGFRNSAFRNQPLTPEAKLALGTIKLEGTPHAVDPSEAGQLLPLWQLLAQLNGSSSTAPQEVTAVLDQIRATMAPDQLRIIGGMQLTSSDVFSAFQADRNAGTGSGFGTQSGAAGPATNRTGGGQRGGGGFVFVGPGFPGGGGFGGANRQGAGANGTGTSLSAAQEAQQASNQLSLILCNQVVQLLQARVKS